ncbi:MAG: hypothetical protein K1X82_13910 [Bacteroidia bacterium]|nr:hypothetical protein [Bacteroidia bacterium]
MKNRILAWITTLFVFQGTGIAQIPVEVFAGHERTSLDIMFFKYFKTKTGNPSHWLFFNRNRASIDYRITRTSFLPQFGFTEAISYNHPILKGFAPVTVVQVLSWGIFPKAGLQYAHVSKKLTLFTWLVCETLKKPSLDYFILFRYSPAISEKLNLFTQLESVNSLPSSPEINYSFTQRVRLGLQVTSYQFGFGADFTQSGRATMATLYNLGGFFRHEF